MKAKFIAKLATHPVTAKHTRLVLGNYQATFNLWQEFGISCLHCWSLFSSIWLAGAFLNRSVKRAPENEKEFLRK